MPDPHDPQFDSLPDALVDRLREMDGPRPFVPSEVDRVVLDQARTHFAGRPAQSAPAPGIAPQRRLSPWLKFGLPLAAAAAIVLSFLAIQTSRMLTDLKEGIQQTPTALAPGGQAELAWDIDRSGKLDILDVYLLAKRREAGDDNITTDILDSLCDRVVSLDRPTAYTDPQLNPYPTSSSAEISYTLVSPSAAPRYGGSNG